MSVGERVVLLCVCALFKAELNLGFSAVRLTFYSSRPWQLHCVLGPDRWS
jgi:hypothetical protein